MIDLHCHLLPGIDDGPESLDEAIGLAAHAVKSGITYAVVTPHVHIGRYENDLPSIRRDLAKFQAELDSLKIPLRLGLGGEVRLGAEVMDLVAESRIPFLGERDGYRIMLLEFPHGHIPVGADKFVAWLLKNRIRPLIAHPERNGRSWMTSTSSRLSSPWAACCSSLRARWKAVSASLRASAPSTCCAAAG